jgi:hypothetical protein
MKKYTNNILSSKEYQKMKILKKSMKKSKRKNKKNDRTKKEK